VLLLFPLSVRMNFDLNVNGLLARFYFFKKNFYTYEKKFGKKTDDEFADDFGSDFNDDFKSSNDERDGEDREVFVPSYVPPPKKVEPKVETRVEPSKEVSTSAAVKDAAPEENSLNESASKVVQAEAKAPAAGAEPMKTEPAEKSESATKTESAEKPASESAVETTVPTDESVAKPEKRKSLTDFEFWTIILTPDLDERAFRYVKSLLAKFIWMFDIRFQDCFVEGIRSDYVSMGYGAAANGIMKGFPWLCDWELRMDWCHDQELRSEGSVKATVNLCRICFFSLVLLTYGSVLGISFWRRRARILKTNELPELGYVRRKIRGWMVED